VSVTFKKIHQEQKPGQVHIFIPPFSPVLHRRRELTHQHYHSTLTRTQKIIILCKSINTKGIPNVKGNAKFIVIRFLAKFPRFFSPEK